MKSHLQALLSAALASLSRADGLDLVLPAGLQIDATKDPRHGDFATNLALIVAKPLGRPPRAVAELIVRHLPQSDQVAKVEIAGPGFINFFLAPDAFQAVVSEVLRAGRDYGCDRSHARGKILIEFVSANPTGPIHVGHGRGAAYGDSLANILAATGWNVHREYYINDAGRQVDVLTVSVWLRYLEECGSHDTQTFSCFHFPTRGYQGDYIVECAAQLRDKYANSLYLPPSTVFDSMAVDSGGMFVPGTDPEVAKRHNERLLDILIERIRTLLGPNFELVKQFALDQQLATIRATLDAFGVRFDQWTSEKSVVDSGFARGAFERLRAGGHVYEQDGATWLRTSHLGDEKDRVLFKADGAATYFANDLAYHIDKLDRAKGDKPPTLLDVWGADHHGYIARVRAAIEALTGRKDALQVQLMQFVTLSSGKMGKRSGNFVTLQDLIDAAGKDATRFFYLLRSHDQHLEFDIELARSQSNDNPVYYVQYAHARICSVFRQLAERGQQFDPAQSDAALHRLLEPQEKTLLSTLQKYPETLAAAGSQYAPHLLAFYLRELADALHSYYNAHKFLATPRSEQLLRGDPGLATPRSEQLLRGDPGVEDVELQTARLALIAATRQVLANGLGLLGVSAPESM